MELIAPEAHDREGFIGFPGASTMTDTSAGSLPVIMRTHGVILGALGLIPSRTHRVQEDKS